MLDDFFTAGAAGRCRAGHRHRTDGDVSSYGGGWPTSARPSAHSALLGVAVAIVLDIDLAIGIFATASAVVLIMFFLERSDALPTDTMLGLLAHGGLSLGLVVLAFFPSMRFDLHALLFGDILAVTRVDLLVIWAGGAGALAVLWWIWRPLLAATVSTDLATVAGLQPERAPTGVRVPGGGDHIGRRQDRRDPADRRVAGDTTGDGPALRVEPGENGRRRGRGGHCRHCGRTGWPRQPSTRRPAPPSSRSRWRCS